jgi:alpha-mannosidase
MGGGESIIREGREANLVEVANRSTGLAETAQLKAVQILEQGPVRSKIRVESGYGDSVFYQDLILWDRVPWIIVETTVDLREENLTGWTVFPSRIESASFTVDIPFGFERRPQDGGEVTPASWLDLSDRWESDLGYGLAVLTDGKTRCSVKNGVLKVSGGHPESEKGLRTFRYALLPHRGDFRAGEAVRRAYEYGVGLAAFAAEVHSGDLPTEHSFLGIAGEGVVMTALKPAETGKGLVLRLVESHGRPAKVTVDLSRPVDLAYRSNLLEERLEPTFLPGKTLEFDLKPFQIATFVVMPGS